MCAPGECGFQLLAGSLTLVCCVQPTQSPYEVDLLHPLPSVEASRHKLKRLVQTPNSFFMDVKCPGCTSISIVFSHAQTVIQCTSCMILLAQPTGGKARLTEGCSFRKKTDY